MMAYKYLTYEEFNQLATEWYNWGGDSYAECWDEYSFRSYVEMFGPITKSRAKKMFRENYYEEREERAMAHVSSW